MIRHRLYPHQVPVDVQHLWPMLLGYVRYAMGRMSTAPSTAAELVRCYASALTQEQREQIRDEIRAELDRREKRGEKLGMDCDHRTWRELLRWIEECC